MSRFGFSFVFAIFHFVCAVQSQIVTGTEDSGNTEISSGSYLQPIELSSSEYWLLSKNDPVPAVLNQFISQREVPSNIKFSTLADNGVLSSIYNEENLEPSVPPRTYENTVSGYEPSQFYDSIRKEDHTDEHEQILIELPRGVSSGFWETPRPQLIDILSTRGRQADSNFQDILNSESPESNIEQLDDIFPIKEISTRLPLKLVPLNGNGSFEEVFYEMPFQTNENNEGQFAFEENNSSYIDERNTFGQQFIFTPVQGRTLDEILNDDNKPLYEISFDQFPSEEFDSDQSDIKLTPEDIELLEKLGILSSLLFKATAEENKTNTSNNKYIEREVESSPHYMDNIYDKYNISKNINMSNNTDVEFIQVPDFVLPPYYENISDDSDKKEKSRPIPYVIAVPTSDSDTDKLLSVPLTNVSATATKMRNQPQFSERNSLSDSSYNSTENSTSGKYSEHSSSSTLKPETEKDFEISNFVKNSTLTKMGESKPFVLENLDFNAKESLLQTNKNLKLPATRRESSGLVSLGQIQPRFLEKISKETLKNENEIIEFFTGNVTHLSDRKRELLRKLKLEPKPYVFSYAQKDDNGTLLHRNESSSPSGVVQGSYGYRDPMGIYRNVNYIADEKGFHAVVRTNEPGTISHSTADVVVMSENIPSNF